PTGNIVIDDDILVYYGAADKVCCVATINLDELLGELLRYSTL
ncbi:MAG: glycosidase, partial [Thermoprotei archaeon]